MISWILNDQDHLACRLLLNQPRRAGRDKDWSDAIYERRRLARRTGGDGGRPAANHLNESGQVAGFLRRTGEGQNDGDARCGGTTDGRPQNTAEELVFEEFAQAG